MMVDQAFCEATGGNVKRNITDRETNSYPEYLSIPMRTNLLCFHNGRGPV